MYDIVSKRSCVLTISSDHQFFNRLLFPSRTTAMFVRSMMCPLTPVHVVPDGITLFHLVDPLTQTNHSSSYSRLMDGDSSAKAGADIESLKKQLQIVDQRLATLTGRLEVLKAVQQVLPPGELSLIPFPGLILAPLFHTKKKPTNKHVMVC